MEYLFIFQFWYCEFVGGWGVLGWYRKSYLESAKIASYAASYTACHIDWIFLRFILMSHYCFAFSSFGILNIGLPLSCIILQSTATQITISINSVVSIIIQYEISVFIKISVKVFYIQISNLIQMRNTAFIFKNHGSKKKLTIEKTCFFSVDYVKKLNCMLYTHDVTCNLSRWNNGGNDIYKKINKN